jgi:hypothetical protein
MLYVIARKLHNCVSARLNQFASTTAYPFIYINALHVLWLVYILHLE